MQFIELPAHVQLANCLKSFSIKLIELYCNAPHRIQMIAQQYTKVGVDCVLLKYQV